MTTDAPKLMLLGDPDAVACEGDSCLVLPPVRASTGGQAEERNAP